MKKTLPFYLLLLSLLAYYSAKAQIYRYITEYSGRESSIRALFLSPLDASKLIGTTYQNVGTQTLFIVNLKSLQTYSDTENVVIKMWARKLSVSDTTIIEKILGQNIDPTIPAIRYLDFYLVGRGNKIRVFNSKGEKLKKDTLFKAGYKFPQDIKGLSRSEKKRISKGISINQILYVPLFDKIFVATNVGLFELMKNKNRKFKYLRFLIAGNIRSLKFSSDSILYFVTDDKIVRMNLNDYKEIKMIYRSYLKNLYDFVMVDSSLWIGTKDGLILKRNGKEILFNKYSKIPFRSETPHNLILDTINHYLWIATWGSGLYYIDLDELDSILTLQFCGDTLRSANGKSEKGLFIYKLYDFTHEVFISWNFYSVPDTVKVYDGYYRFIPDTLKPVFEWNGKFDGDKELPIKSKYVTVVIKPGDTNRNSSWSFYLNCAKKEIAKETKKVNINKSKYY